MAKRVKAEVDITEGVIWKQLLTFFFPILLGTFFQQLYNTADAIIVGKFVSTEALAAVGGATGTLINLIVGFFVGLSSGATVILAQHYGARRNEDVSKTVHTGLALAISGGFVIMVLGILLTPFLLKLLNTPDDVMVYAQTYMRVYFAGMIPSLIYNIGSGILRAVGDSRRPLYFLIASCMVNIVLDVLFVLGFEMGVAGAALATILSQTVSAVLVIVVLTRSSNSYQLQIRKLGFDTTLLGRIVKIGLPAGLQSVMYSLSNVIVQSSINAFGTTVMAAWTAWGKMDGTFWMIISAFGIAITTFTGQNFGAGKYKRINRVLFYSMIIVFLVGFVMGNIMNYFGEDLLRLYSPQNNVIQYGMIRMQIIMTTYFLCGFMDVMVGSLRGLGFGIMPMLVSLIGACGLRILWVFTIFEQYRTLESLYYSYPVTWGITVLAHVICFCIVRRRFPKEDLASSPTL